MDRELFDASNEGNVGEVLHSLLSGADPSSTFDECEQTSLHVKCWKGHLEAAQVLLLVKAGVEARDKDGWTPLHYACHEGHSEIVQTLVQVGADINAKDNENETPLMKACWNGQVKVVQLLLEKGVGLGAVNTGGATALHAACHYWSTIQNPIKSIEICACAGKEDPSKLVALLLENSADQHARNTHEDTPLHLACAGKEDRSKLVGLLLDNGAEVEARNFAGETPLHRACYFSQLKVCELLLESRAHMEANSSDGCTPLICAANSDCDSDEDIKEVARLLLEKGANVNARKNSGVTALHYACVAHGRLETARFLQDHDAALGAKDEHNDTPLHWACFSNNLDVVKELVERGADIFTEGEDKATPFDQAAVDGTTEVAAYLLEQYKDKLWKQEGGISLHATLGDTTNLENNKVQLPIGTVTVDQLLALLLSIHEQDMDSIHIQDGNRALPIHIACCANAPMKVLCFCVEKDEATLHMMDSAGARLTHNACRGGASLEKFKYLIKKGGVGTLCAWDNQFALPLHDTCQSKP